MYITNMQIYHRNTLVSELHPWEVGLVASLSIKQSRFPLSVCLCMLRSLNTQRILMRFFSVIQEEGLYGYKMRNTLEKHFSTSIALV
jgi:hypothetical protein